MKELLPYTERDFVLKNEDAGALIEECAGAGANLRDAEARRLVEARLEEARERGAEAAVFALGNNEGLELVPGWDELRGEYYIIIKNFYEPHNLLNVLYERISSGEDDGDVRGLVKKYLGVIEEKEKISLADTAEKLSALAEGLYGTLALYEEEDEYSEEDIEKFFASLEKAYFEPMGDILDGLLITLAGRGRELRIKD